MDQKTETKSDDEKKVIIINPRREAEQRVFEERVRLNRNGNTGDIVART